MLAARGHQGTEEEVQPALRLEWPWDKIPKLQGKQTQLVSVAIYTLNLSECFFFPAIQEGLVEGHTHMGPGTPRPVPDTLNYQVTWEGPPMVPGSTTSA